MTAPRSFRRVSLARCLMEEAILALTRSCAALQATWASQIWSTSSCIWPTTMPHGIQRKELLLDFLQLPAKLVINLSLIYQKLFPSCIDISMTPHPGSSRVWLQSGLL